jgi:hypothetical protein
MVSFCQRALSLSTSYRWMPVAGKTKAPVSYMPYG